METRAKDSWENNARYTAILFDLDDTLLNFSACETQALQAAFSIFGIELSDNEWSELWQIYQSISKKYWQQKRSSSLSRQQIIEASLQDTFAALKRDFSDLSNLARVYWNTFCHTACLNSGVATTIKFLSHRYKLGIVTNGYADSQMSRIEASGLSGYFSTLIVSESVGHRKPEPEIFKLALNKLQVSPTETLFVGDSIAHDYQGAINAEIDFCYFGKPSTEISPQYAIAQISQLREIIC